ncbi:host nuclease inhibitor GamL [Mixta intestinalis]|uniref:Uncharacterized protein n=1 Tax=Mixta intestinalis TaxID=1615494 RepID=A0A6P1PZM6_9GAMM|nr:host nuclease inhibitor GamL [Mixta intestinalis]QHM71319.1 hypothetical protein C7M51_01605 [Mixta intestinalis]
MNAYMIQERHKEQLDAGEQAEAQRMARIDSLAADIADKYPETATEFAAMHNLPIEQRLFMRSDKAQDAYAEFVDQLARLQAEELDSLIQIGFMEAV